MLDCFLARVKHLEDLEKQHLGKQYLQDKDNFANILKSLDEIDREDKVLHAEQDKSIFEMHCKDIDANTKKN